MHDYEMEYLFSYTAGLETPPEVIGPTPAGFRLNVYVTGGEVNGPRANGKVLPRGADWLTIRPDGIGILDVRATIETDDGALIYVEYNAVSDAGEDGYQRFVEGNLPDTLEIRAVPRYLTSHPDYLWLNRLQCVNVGVVNLRDPRQWIVSYDVYGLR